MCVTEDYTGGCALRAGPLPRQAFRSFLATAGDPSPHSGGGVVVARSRILPPLRRSWGVPGRGVRAQREAVKLTRCAKSAAAS